MSESSDMSGAREVFDKFRERLLLHDMEGSAALWADDGVIDWPFVLGPTGGPLRLRGRDAIRVFKIERGYSPTSLRLDSIASAEIHDTRDPDEVIVELELLPTQMKTAESHTLRAIQVMRVREGKLVFMRDYTDPLAAARATGRP